MASQSSVTLVAGLLLLVSSCCLPVQGSHFRGAIIQWSPADPVAFDGTIIVTHRISWRRSSGGAFCDASTIASGHLIGNGNLLCQTGCSGTVGSMQFQCTDFSEDEDWSSGQYSYTYDISGVDYFEASYSGSAWIDKVVIGDGTWEVRVKGSLAVRSDSGRINTSPITAISPILRLQHGCNHTIDIPSEDIDGDEVRCRWARTSDGECGDVCNAFPGAILDERNCQLQYEAVGSTGWYAVALQMEDFICPNATTPLSSVPIQFLVLVLSSDEPCTQKPEFVGVTRAAGSCIGVPLNTTFHEPLIAMSGEPTVSIVAIDTVSPQGLRKSLLASGPGGSQWHVNITWEPNESQFGPNIFCYTAVDSIGLTSNQLCLTLLGGVEAPNFIPGSVSPIGLIFPNHTQWSIQLDKQFLRPVRSKFIRIIGENGHEVVRIDVSLSSSVVYPEGSLGREFRFTTSFLFAEGMQFYVTMDPGIAVGPEFCGAESPALHDPNIWMVSIADVTPPSLVFLTNEQFSNENFTIAWRFNEEATATCTLQTPTVLFTEICNNQSFRATYLQEGLHFLFVQEADLAGNIGPTMRYGWTVDLSPPIITLASIPSLVSNATMWTFTYECADISGCSFSCSAQEMGQPSQHSPCVSSYLVDSLVNGREYEFELIATDGVGNVGQPTLYQWKIDLTPPMFTSINNISVSCGQDLSPNATGVPQVTDNEDPLPTLEFEDIPSDGCAFQRIWLATDDAGNMANQLQHISLTSPLPPVIVASSITFLPCGSVEDAILNVQELQKGITVHHPCNRPVELSFTNSAIVDRCGFTFIRTWLAEDDCGGSSTFQQTVRVLDQQFPDTPENGQLNTNLHQALMWPQYPGAYSYEVYVWRFVNVRPTMPTAVTTLRHYQPSLHYPPGTKMSWQVEYRTDVNVTVPSPVWGFETETVPDLAVTNIALPPFAFSGQDFDVSWTVINVGNLSSGSEFWSDQVWMGPTRDISDGRIVATAQQRRILDPSDGYMSQTGVDLRNTDIGTFYVFVETDIYRTVNDIDRSNNRITSILPLQVRLTPPPNLEVTDVQIPQSTFSGESISIRWTVENTGSGVTATDQWFDRVYWSNDRQIDADDLVLGEFQNSGVLAPGATYAQVVTRCIPQAIFEDYFIIVVSDIHNQVYEHGNEADNARISDGPIDVTLSPPPDLVVSSIVVGEEHATGSVIVIKYTVTNNGAGAPFESFWTDKTVLIDQSTGSQLMLDSSFRYGTVQPGESYSKEVQYFVSPNLATGQYNLTVHTDASEQVFEFLSNDNNMLSKSICIILHLSDLTVSKIEASLSSSSEGNTVGLNYTVINIGSGRSIGSPWVDRVGVSFSPFLDDDTEFVANHISRNELLPNQSYSVELLVNLASDTFGELYFHVITDYYNRVIEENDNNNQNGTGPVSAQLIQPDLVVESIQVSTDAILSGNEVQLSWTVANLGNGTLKDARWTDTIYLAMSSVLAVQAVRLNDFSISYTLKPSESYNYSTSINIPKGLSGRYYLFVQTDNFQQVDEADDTGNNVDSMPLLLELPPPPDLIIQNISASYSDGDENDRILTIQWTVLNVGNSMLDEMFWTDQLSVSSDPVFDRQNAIRLADKEVVGQLQAYQEYFLTSAVILPNDAFGSLFVYVEVDSANNIAEIAAEDNNIGRSANQVSMPRPILPQLSVQINSDILPSSAFSGDTLSLQYDVSNVGKASIPLSSWTDSVYLVTEEDASRNAILENGLIINTILHNRNIGPREQFKVFVNISTPPLLNELWYFAVVVDINGNLGDPAVIGINGNIHSESNDPFLIQQGPLPDLVALPPIGNLTTRGGQPVNVTLQVANIGNKTAIGVWYGAVYISRDAQLGRFDRRLKTVLGPSSLDESTTYTQIEEIFLPIDLPSATYYLFYEVDVGNSIPEVIESDNNIAREIFAVLNSINTDIAVVDVNISPASTRYEDDLTASWSLRNNGGVVAEGYKCDTVYLSEDDEWDVMDHQLGETECGNIFIHPYDQSLENDLSFQFMTSTPFIAQQDYTGIVRSRGNIRDLNLANNIGITQGTLSIQAQSISLNSPTVITLQQGQNKVYRIDSVPGEETLVATLKAATQNTYNDLFLRYEKPPTGFDYDAFSQRALSVDQKCVVRNTRNGTYYLRVESSTSKMQSDYSVEILAKIATFEIVDIVPSKAAPLGDVTLQISGTVIGYAVDAYIYSAVNSTQLHSAKTSYWFSSEEVYATFDIADFPFGNYTVRLIDRRTAAVAEIASAFEVAKGIPGQTSLQVMPPGPLRPGESGQLSVFIQNTGNTDILSPLISASSGGNILLRLLHDSIQSDTASSATSFQTVASNGPAGILPPGGFSQMYFELRPKTPLVAREELLVAVIPDLTSPHAYIGERDLLRPSLVPANVWDTIWDNALLAVGLTWASFEDHASDLVTQMSLVHDRRPLSSYEIMEYALKVADGLYTARILVYVEDISSDIGDMPLPLVVQRYYSSYISKRRTSGPCGKGWLLAWWELHVFQITSSEVELQRDRELVVFTAIGEGVYVNGDSQISVTDEEVVYNNPNAIEVYFFDRMTGQLTRIENLVDESSIMVQYNDKQEPVSFGHSNGDTMTITYSDSGQIMFADIKDQQGNDKQSSSYAYDSSGMYLMAVTVSGQSESYSYNEGDLIETVQATQERKRFFYDDRGLLVESAVYSDSEKLVSSVAITYDWNGLATIRLQPENRTLTTYIDLEGNPKLFSSSPEIPPIVQIDFPPSAGRKLVVGDQVLSEIRMDAETNTLHLKEGNEKEIVYGLGDNDEIVSVTDNGGQTYGAMFDDTVGLRELIYPDGSKLVVDYGSDGHIAGIMNPDGSEIFFSYDSQDNLLSKVADGVESRYEYDDSRRLTRGTNDEGTLEISYSRAGVPTKIVYPNGRQLSYGYNAKFQRVYIADDSGYNISYTYNDRDQVSEIIREDNGKWIARFNYTVRGELAKKTYANGVYTEYEYDSEGRLLTLRNFNHNETLLSMFTYEYNIKGEVMAVNTLNGSWSFKYDPISQLTSWVAPTGEVTEVRYDSRGNRLTQTSQGSTRSYSVNSINQYMAYGDSDTFAYDTNGNLINKVASGRTELFTFNSEGRLTEVEDQDKRCSYKYDALGNLYRKVCSDGTTYVYLMDPFGPYGTDVIAEISSDNVMYFVHSMEQGLLAAFGKNREWYYQFNGDNSVVTVLDKAGETLNSYEYDPFGRVVSASECERNIFQYVGQLGVIKDEAVENIFMMRARHYDATHGKFLSFDPIGFAGVSPNLYVYAGNNPLAVKDPTGEFVVFLTATVGRAAYAAGVYLVATPSSQYTLGGVVGSAVSGVAKLPLIGNALGSITEDLVDRGSVDWGDVAKDTTWGAAFGPVAKKFGKLISNNPGKLVMDLARKAEKRFAKSLSGPLRGAYDRLREKGSKFVRSHGSTISDFIKDTVNMVASGKIRMEVGEYIYDHFGDEIEEAKARVMDFWMDVQNYIMSFDPNDIIGPSGYGDAHFIPANVVLEYKIRFENDANATAPAQRVFISHQLDDDLDERTFRVGSFGFGDFTQNITVQRAFIQDVVNLTESLGVLVRVRAGIDVINSEAFWEFQSIDPETGDAPVDPTVGFLPPNNGTNGQGFVTFTVRAKQQLGTLPTIDAEASIIFDQNEPIDTPPIFNTIDNVAPSVNVTAIQDLLNAGTPAVRFGKSDVGSGVATVDLYLLEDGQVRPLLQGTTGEAAILPLSQGFQYQLVAIAVDNVGNTQTLEDALSNVIPLNTTAIPITCQNDCSGQGSCSSIGICQCQSGFYGVDCSEVTPPLEPPFLDFTSPTTASQEDDPITIYVSAIPIRNTTGANDQLVVSISSLPSGTILSKGARMENGVWKLIQADFGDLEIVLPTHFSGMFELQATAYFENHQNTTSRSRGLLFTIEPIPDAPYLAVQGTCFDATSGNTVDVLLESRLVDMNGLEVLSLIVHGLPENVGLSMGNSSSNGKYLITSTMLQIVQLRVPNEFQPFTFEVTAYSTVTTTMMQINVTMEVTIQKCVKKEGVCLRAAEQIDIQDFIFSWPETHAGDVFIIQCPCRDFNELTEDLFAVRECGGDGSWLQTEFSTCVSNRRMALCEGGDLAETLFGSLALLDTLTNGDVAILFSAASTLLTAERINNVTARNELLDAFDQLLSADDDVLLTLSETTSIGEKLVSTFDNMGELQGLIPGTPFMVARTRFAVDFVEISVDSLPDKGYDVMFGEENGEQVNLPKSLFDGYTGNPRISTSQLKKTALFRGRDESITIASNVISVNVLEKEVKDLMEPVTMKFKKNITTPSNMISSCRFLNTSASRVTGKWSTEGCRLLQETEEEITCACDHLSSFAVIMTTADATNPPPFATTSVAAIVVPMIIGILLIAGTVVIVLVIIRKAEGGKKQYSVDASYSKQMSHNKVIENVRIHEEKKGLERETSFTVSSDAKEHVEICL